MLTHEQARALCTGCTVVVVDDRDSVRGVVRAILEDAGANVLDAATVGHAQTLLEQSRPDAVLTDLELTPHWRGGIAVLEHVKRRWPSCPVLLLTAWSDEMDRLRTLGFDAVLLKPTAPADLVAVVAAVIERGRDSQRSSVAAA
jgi:DNA-binding response OmpR family regulator